MKTVAIAIDLSTNAANIAALSGGNTIAERAWTETRARTALFDMIPALLEEAGADLDSVVCYVVGLGPGSYMGLRISLSAAAALALPDQKPVYGVNSAEPIAAAAMAEFSCNSAAVVGDARRGFLWLRMFGAYQESREHEGQDETWRLIKPEELGRLCPPGTAIASPDWDRIGTILEQSVPDSVLLLKERRTPSAAVIGRIAYERARAGSEPEPLSPIYINPAVSQNCRRA